MPDALKMQELGEEANEAVGRVGMVKASVMLSEGFCPICVKRSSSTPVLDFEPDEDERPSVAVVHCAGCRIVWRTGHNPDNPTVPVWIEHTRGWKGMYMTMCLNPPNDPEPEEDWWDEEG